MSSTLQVGDKFAEICSDFVNGESNDFNKDYREVVTEMQVTTVTSGYLGYYSYFGLLRLLQ